MVGLRSYPPPPIGPKGEKRVIPIITIIFIIAIILLFTFLLLFFTMGLGRPTIVVTTHVSTTETVTTHRTQSSTSISSIIQTSLYTVTQTITSPIGLIYSTTASTSLTSTHLILTTEEHAYTFLYFGLFGNMDTSDPPPFEFTVDNTHQVAQKFEITNYVKLEYLAVWGRRTSAPSGKFRIVVTRDNAGVPGSTITAVEVDAASVGGGWNWITVSCNVILQPGTYWILVYSTSTTQYRVGASGNSIVGLVSTSGDGGATWSSESARDLLYKLQGYITP